jgi:hypothetical protein
MKKKIIALGLGLMGSMVANAADAKAITGIVFGGQIGYSSGFDAPASGGGVTYTNGNVNFGGLVGYDFALTDMFSVGAEVDVNYTPDIFEVSGAGQSIKYSSLNVPIMITGKFVLPIGLNLFAKGGINYQRLNATCSGNAVSAICDAVETTNAQWNGVLAAGVGYQIESLNVFAQYMYVFGKKINDTSDNDGTWAQGIITGGVSYTLPM